MGRVHSPRARRHKVMLRVCGAEAHRLKAATHPAVVLLVRQLRELTRDPRSVTRLRHLRQVVRRPCLDAHPPEELALRHRRRHVDLPVELRVPLHRRTQHLERHERGQVHLSRRRQRVHVLVPQDTSQRVADVVVHAVVDHKQRAAQTDHLVQEVLQVQVTAHLQLDGVAELPVLPHVVAHFVGQVRQRRPRLAVRQHKLEVLRVLRVRVHVHHPLAPPPLRVLELRHREAVEQLVAERHNGQLLVVHLQPLHGLAPVHLLLHERLAHLLRERLTLRLLQHRRHLDHAHPHRRVEIREPHGAAEHACHERALASAHLHKVERTRLAQLRPRVDGPRRDRLAVHDGHFGRRDEVSVAAEDLLLRRVVPGAGVEHSLLHELRQRHGSARLDVLLDLEGELRRHRLEVETGACLLLLEVGVACAVLHVLRLEAFREELCFEVVKGVSLLFQACLGALVHLPLCLDAEGLLLGGFLGSQNPCGVFSLLLKLLLRLPTLVCVVVHPLLLRQCLMLHVQRVLHFLLRQPPDRRRVVRRRRQQIRVVRGEHGAHVHLRQLRRVAAAARQHDLRRAGGPAAASERGHERRGRGGGVLLGRTDAHVQTLLNLRRDRVPHGVPCLHALLFLDLTQRLVPLHAAFTRLLTHSQLGRADACVVVQDEVAAALGQIRHGRVRPVCPHLVLPVRQPLPKLVVTYNVLHDGSLGTLRVLRQGRVKLVHPAQHLACLLVRQQLLFPRRILAAPG
eukprot:Rhum_TRINITY_DN16863_c0_g1::Rhum_TRINITY_DN16863_c0_g1_i1::g.164665::m.164665